MIEGKSPFFLIARLGKMNLLCRAINRITKKMPFLKFLWFFKFGYREQTIGAYELAYRAGFKTMLCDVLLTKDKQFICSHDDDISNIVYGKDLDYKTKISLVDLVSIKNARFFSNGFRKGGLISLDEFLCFCSEKKLMAEIEIKDFLDYELIQNLKNVVKKYHMDSRIILHRNQGEYEVLQNLAESFPNALLSITANDLSSMEKMINLQLPCKKMVTITNYKGFYPETLEISNLNRLKEEGIGIIFSEVKNKRDEKLMSRILPYFSFVASRNVKIGEKSL